LLTASITFFIIVRFGRKPTFLFCTFWQFTVGFCLSFVQSYTVYAILFFLSGSGSTINFMVATVIGERLIEVSYTAYYMSGWLLPNEPKRSLIDAYRAS